MLHAHARGEGRLKLFWSVAVGAALGAIASVPAARLVEKFTFGISALDATTRAVALVILMGFAFSASRIPARRASRVEPLVALRDE